jgi:hypothetical protein
MNGEFIRSGKEVVIAHLKLLARLEAEKSHEKSQETGDSVLPLDECSN